MKLNKQIIPGKYLYFYADDMFVKGFHISGFETSYCTSQASNVIGYKKMFSSIQFNIL
jgi:hypothetical protein